MTKEHLPGKLTSGRYRPGRHISRIVPRTESPGPAGRRSPLVRFRSANHGQMTIASQSAVCDLGRRRRNARICGWWIDRLGRRSRAIDSRTGRCYLGIYTG
jgi:hypothetical protein